ncbi:MAG: hypothetical protein ABSD92_07045 [Candidatus Bathyarchaeia archaeon]|jgi:uncharacterized membrane protein
MKALKIIAVLTLVALAAALLIASAYAYTGGRIGTSVSANSNPTGTSYSGYGGMMRGYGYYSPSTTMPATPSNQYPVGGWGCRA